MRAAQSTQTTARPTITPERTPLRAPRLAAFRVLLAELRDGTNNAGEGHAERNEHEGAHTRGAPLDVERVFLCWHQLFFSVFAHSVLFI